MLTVGAERGRAPEASGERFHRFERRYERLDRTIGLPQGVDEDDEEEAADCTASVLTVTVPKLPAQAKPRRIRSAPRAQSRRRSRARPGNSDRAEGAAAGPPPSPAAAARGMAEAPHVILKQYYLGLPRARVVPHRRRGDADGGRRRPAARRRALPRGRGELGLAIRHVFLTHFHADFVAGPPRAARPRRARAIHLGARARGRVRVRAARATATARARRGAAEVLETPGHTPESISILVYDPRAARRSRTPC